jgi:hypothetical protein
MGRRDRNVGVVSLGMQRLCERPGCSDPASVAYGMRAEDLVFWLDALRDRDSESDLDPGGRGVLCRRHADSMVVPRDWTLDDLRQPDLHLFRPPAGDASTARPRRRRVPAGERSGEQLALGVDAEDAEDGGDAEDGTDGEERVASDDSERVGEPGQEAAPDAHQEPVADADSEPDEVWTPDFDESDDLDGLLAARSPLLARAFRGTDRAKDA